jgi:hypothetical protein
MQLFSRRTARSLLAALACLGALGLAPDSVRADGYAPPGADTQARELFKLGRERKSSIVVTGSKFRRGRAEIFVNAPVAKVRAAVLDYGNYSTFMRRFQKSKVLRSDASGTEVYVQVPVLNGAASLWAVERFGGVYKVGNEERVDGKFVKGNLDDLAVTWSWRAVDDTHTVLALELFLVPKLAAPLMSMVNQEAQDASGEGTLAVRDRAEIAAGNRSAP